MMYFYHVKFKSPVVLALLSFLSFCCAAQEYPRMMRMYNGKVMDIRYRGDSGFYCMDYKGKRFPCLEVDHRSWNAAKFLYVDSTGKPINNELYDYAEPFMGGVAKLKDRKTNPETYAIINTKAEFIAPFSADHKMPIGHGLFVVDTKTKKQVYNRQGKLITECSDCWVRVFDQMKNMVIGPLSQSSENPVVSILSPDGKELYSSRGRSVQELNNGVSGGTHHVIQPYYKIQVEGNRYAVVSDEGKLVLDSVESFSFYQGKGIIKKNKLASVIDTNFKTLMPFSFGYDFYMPFQNHPQGAYCARKNGKYMVVDSSGKQLIPVTSTVTYITYRSDFKMYELRAPDIWFASMRGDTIFSPKRYSLKYILHPNAPGFIVTKKNENLSGYISEEGKLTIPCKYDQLAYGGKNMLLFFDENKAGYLDLQGNLKFYVDEALKLSSFFQGYALCSVKMSNNNKYSPSAQSVSTGRESYQVQNKLIDSTGKFVSDESYDWLFLMKDGFAHVIKNGNHFMVDQQLKMVRIGNCQMMSYFYKGYALIFDPVQKTWGLINNKLEVMVPPIYDKIDTKEDERRYGYQLYSKRGMDSPVAVPNFYANIRNGELKVLPKGAKDFVKITVDAGR